MKKISAFTILALFLVGSCSTSRITSSWTAENVRPGQYKKILVLGLINEPDRTIREKMEEQLVGELKKMGYDAVCSCDEFGAKSFENMKEQEALARLTHGGIDAVMTVVLLDKQKEKHYVPEKLHYSPHSNYHEGFWDYYTSVYGRVYQPGYYTTTDTRYFWETNFYNLKEGQELLYSVQSQSFDPGSASRLGKEYGQMIMKDLKTKNILLVKSDGDLKAF